MSEDKRDTGQQTGVTLYRPVIVAILYLATLFTGFTILVGLILAYVWRGEEGTTAWEETHFTYLIRTFWIGFWVAIVMAAAMIGSAIALSAAHPVGPEDVVIDADHSAMIVVVFGGLAIWFALFVWYCVRTIRSLANAASQQAMPNPKTCLF
ncbi:hypothetical protein [Citromicrobium bathyomarinum]|uniref:DUF4870 family protein n=1 Tax=Citromicrobium bathyomarinum TaxID=72174 RepID=UPI003159F06B